MEDRPIIVKRIKKGGGGHHGGAWKIAFADFAMAMMAFFLVLWATNQATPEQKQAIESYFRDPIGFEQGGMPDPIDLGGRAAMSEGPDTIAPEELRIDDDDIRDLADSMEKRETQQLLQELESKIDESEILQQFRDQLLIDITDEGLRIQIVDRSQRPMFDSGRAELKFYSEDILFELAAPLASFSRRLSITGHTDGIPFQGRDDYSNWELSADRANTARRALVAGGVANDQVARVVGLGDSVLFDRTNPQAPVNRRISIIVLNKKTSDAIQKSASSSHSASLDQSTPGDLEEDGPDWFERTIERQVDEQDVNW
ncbi:MAG: motility protein MotB [Halomonadaceae bacterium]|nr:MAG: motility protein MotB [Halomonadaceae bacterium]